MRTRYLFFALCLFTAGSWAQGNTRQAVDVNPGGGVSRYVNPLIGTSGEGYTYPGAVSPWGMVSASPHTTYTSQFDYVVGNTTAPAGYYHGEPLIHGFGQTHLSGTACNELGAPVLAVNSGELTPAEHSSAYTKEIARAGYYSVQLTDANTTIEATTTQRAAYYRIQFHNNADNYVLLDATTNLSWRDHEGVIERHNKREYSGWSQTGNFCSSGNAQKVYFFLKVFSEPVGSGIWQRGGKTISEVPTAEGDVGAWLAFKGAETVTVAIGISYVSEKNARENLYHEIGDRTFDRIKAENIQRWDTQLGKVVVNDAGKEEQKTIFYTALYHALIHPNVVSDVNGDYPLYESDPRAVGNNTNYPRYGLFSLWDSYRNVHALLSLLYPEQQQAMLYTLEDMTISSGHPPRWELYGSETLIMVGDPAVSVMGEGMVKGFKFNNPQKLFATLYKSARDTDSEWRPGNAEYIARGYIPEKTDEVWGSVSTTLEYNYHDWALAQMAEALGHDTEAGILNAQSISWRALFNPQNGTVRPKTRSGEWLSDFDPTAMDDSWWIKLVIKNHGGPGFVEGNAYQYTYMVPHDIDGLIDLFGSTEAFTRQLAYIFENGQFTLWNEPNMAYPYLFGVDPSRFAYMQKIIQQQRSTNFSNSPGGIPGNDDTGVLSAWYVFTALGFYPVNPTSGDYQIGVPLFQDLRIIMPADNAELRIVSDFDTSNGAWRRVSFNQDALSTPVISHADLVSGGTLTFSEKE
jgi:predicted alpha-1,2-mannosidase